MVAATARAALVRLSAVGLFCVFACSDGTFGHISRLTRAMPGRSKCRNHRDASDLRRTVVPNRIGFVPRRRMRSCCACGLQHAVGLFCRMCHRENGALPAHSRTVPRAKLGLFCAGGLAFVARVLRRAPRSPRWLCSARAIRARTDPFGRIAVGSFWRRSTPRRDRSLRRSGSSRVTAHGSGPEQSSGLGVSANLPQRSVERGTPWATSLVERERASRRRSTRAPRPRAATPPHRDPFTTTPASVRPRGGWCGRRRRSGSGGGRGPRGGGRRTTGPSSCCSNQRTASSNAHGFAERGVVAELVEHERRRVPVGGHAAEGDGGPDAFGLLQVGEVVQAPLDGEAVAAGAEQGAEAQGGGHDVAPAAVGFLAGDDGADSLAADAGRGTGSARRAG